MFVSNFMKNNIKIIINSSPRSGHAWLQFLLIHELDYARQIDIGEGRHDNFIIRSSVPIMTHAKFDDIQQVTILRDPRELIPSIVTKTMGGLGNTITSGIAMPHEYPELPEVSQLLNDQFNIYDIWTNGIYNNINNLSAFTFEQVSNDFEFVTSKILQFHNMKCLNIKNAEKEKLLELAKERIDVHNKGNYGFNNPIPVDRKPEIYYKIQEIANSFPRMDEAIKQYKTVKDIIEEKHNIHA